MRRDVHREVARLMSQLRRLCTLAVNKQLGVVGASLHEYVVLQRLSEDGEVAQSELAFDAAVDPAAVSRLVRDLAAQGLVTTRVDETDKRQRFVALTPKGRTKESALAPIVDGALEPYMRGLSEQEEDEFLRLLRKAYAAVTQVAAESKLELTSTEGLARKSRPSARTSVATPRRSTR